MTESTSPRRLYDTYIFDIDGTVCLGDELLPTASDTIGRLRELGKRVVFSSNDASHSRSQHAERLTHLGIDADPEDFLTPTSILVGLLNSRMPGGLVLVLGGAALREALGSAGFALTSEAGAERVDAVVVSHDRSFDYAQLRAAFLAVRGGAKLYATNADAFRPTSDGGEPGTGAALAAVERCTGTSADAVAGKPTIHMREAVLRIVERHGRTCLIIGDQLDTDIRMGVDGGIDSALVLTGVTDRRVLEGSRTRPTYVIDQLADLLDDDFRQHYERNRELV